MYRVRAVNLTFKRGFNTSSARRIEGGDLAFATAAAVATTPISLTVTLILGFSTLIVATGLGIYTYYPWETALEGLENISHMSNDNKIALLSNLLKEISVKYVAIQSSSEELLISFGNVIKEFVIPNLNNLTPENWNNLLELHNTTAKTLDDIYQVERDTTKIITTMVKSDPLNGEVNILDVPGSDKIYNKSCDLHRELQNTRLNLSKKNTQLGNYIKLHRPDLFTPTKPS